MALVVQQINRAGAAISTHKFDSNKVVIGRAFDCDVILQDPHVEPHHMVVEMDPATQKLSGSDLSTLNGTWRVEQNRYGVPGRKKSRFFNGSPFFSGQIFELGRTHLRICSATHEVAPAIPVSRWEVLGHNLAHWWIYSLFIVLLIILQVWDAYLSDPKDNKLSQYAYALSALYPILMAVGFAGVCGFIGKNIRHDAKFPAHLSAALAALFAVSLFEFSAPYWAFQFELWRWQTTIVSLFTAATVFVLGYVALSFATHLKGFVRGAVASVVPAMLMIPTGMALLSRPEFQPMPPYDRSMVEPAMQFRAVTDVEEFLQATHQLYSESLADSQDESTETSDESSEESAVDTDPDNGDTQ